MRASDKDLPVIIQYLYEVLLHNKCGVKKWMHVSDFFISKQSKMFQTKEHNVLNFAQSFLNEHLIISRMCIIISE